MRLLETLRSTEQSGKSAVRRQVERAREEWNDLERRIRQRMRIYPQKIVRKVRPVPEAEPESQELSMAAKAGVAGDHKPIISVHGRDLNEHELGE
jgi:hypothetical protein